MRILFMIPLVGSLLGCVVLAFSLLVGSAPQQAAGAAFAIGMGVLPYVLVRSIMFMNGRTATQNADLIVAAIHRTAAAQPALHTAPQPEPNKARHIRFD